MKRFFVSNLALCALICCFAATSCSKDDDGGSGISDDPQTLVGYWQAVRVEGWEPCDEHGKDVFNDDETSAEIVFHFDGNTLRVYEAGDLVSTSSYTFYYDPEEAYLAFNNAVYFDNAIVTTLTGSRLVLQDEYEDNPDGYRKVTFRRISSL